jgi:hypothetical protein
VKEKEKNVSWSVEERHCDLVKKNRRERSNFETPTICWKHMLKLIYYMPRLWALKYTPPKYYLISSLINHTITIMFFICPFEEKV